MDIVRRIVRFWIDFIIGDAWEVATGIGLTLVVVGVAVDRVGGARWLGFVLVAVVLAVTWIALLRTTAAQRRGGRSARAEPAA